VAKALGVDYGLDGEGAFGREVSLPLHVLDGTVDFVGVFGSGDLFSPEDARAMFEATGCDAVMFARGAMGNPVIFPKKKAPKLVTASQSAEEKTLRAYCSTIEGDLTI